MKNRNRLFAGLCLSAVALSMAPQPVLAGNWATEVSLRRAIRVLEQNRDSVRETRDAVNDVREEVRDSADRIIAALRQHAGERSAYTDKQIESDRRMRDAEQQIATQRLRDEFRARAESGEFDPAPDICLLAGLFGGGGNGAPPRGVGTTMVEGIATASSGADPAVREGGTRLNRSIVDDKLAYRGVLGVADPTTNVGVILRNPTLDLGEEGSRERAAATRLVRNMVDPLPPRPVTAAELNTPEGTEREALRTIHETRVSAASELVGMVMNMRDQVQPVTADGLQSYHDDIADYNRPWPGVGGEISELQGLDIRTLRYYAPSAERVQERAALNEKQLLQQILDLLAVQSRISYLQLELDSYRAINESQILSALNTAR